MVKNIIKYFRLPGLLFIPLLILPLFLNSCSSKKEIKEDKFIKIYCDLIIAQDTTNTMNDSIRREIFRRYSVTEEQYNSTILSYNKDPKKWDEFFGKAIDYLGELRKKKDG